MSAPLLACARCGDGVGEHDRFCEGCGLDLVVSRGSTSAARAAFGAPAARACARCGDEPTEADRADDWAREYCGSCGSRRPDGTDRVEVDLGAVGLVSDRGLVHTRNEDAGAVALLAPGAVPGGGAPAAGVVCDGVSSVRRPEDASGAATATALDGLVTALLAGTDSRTALLAATADAARAVAAAGAALHPDPPACTYVAGLARPGLDGTALAVGWIGDSRAYWLDEVGGARLLTEDDSWAGEVVRAGLLDEAAAMADPRAHSITRWVGADTADDPAMVTPHLVELTAPGPGLLLLCTDGLWNYLPEAADLAAVVTGLDPAAAATALTARALEAGGHDNITVAVLAVR